MAGAMEHQAALLLGRLVGTNRMLALVTASQMASASGRHSFVVLRRARRRREASAAPCGPGFGAHATNDATRRRPRCRLRMAPTSERTPARSDASTDGG